MKFPDSSAATGISPQAALPSCLTYHMIPNWRICLFVCLKGKASLNSSETRIVWKSLSFPAFGASVAVRSFKAVSLPGAEGWGLVSIPHSTGYISGQNASSWVSLFLFTKCKWWYPHITFLNRHNKIEHKKTLGIGSLAFVVLSVWAQRSMCVVVLCNCPEAWNWIIRHKAIIQRKSPQ